MRMGDRSNRVGVGAATLDPQAQTVGRRLPGLGGGLRLGCRPTPWASKRPVAKS